MVMGSNESRLITTDSQHAQQAPLRWEQEPQLAASLPWRELVHIGSKHRAGCNIDAAYLDALFLSYLFKAKSHYLCPVL